MLKFMCMMMLLVATNAVATEFPKQISEQTIETGDFVEKKITIQKSINPLDKYIIHKLNKKNIQKRGSVVLAPGGGSGFSLYQIGGSSSIARTIAEAGYSVYGYTPGPLLIPPHWCESNDCSFFQQWTLDSYASDLKLIGIIALIESRHRPFIGGSSLGGILATIAVNNNPWLWRGAFLIESAAYYALPLSNLYQESCSLYTGLLLNGVYWDDQSYPAIVYYYENDPATAIVLFTTPRQPPYGEAPGYQLVAGDASGLTYASETLISEMIPLFTFYDPTQIYKQLYCAWAGDNHMVSNLSNFHGPIISFQSGHGFGEYANDTLDLATHAEKQVEFNSEYGHADWWLDPNSELLNKLIPWLINH